MLAYLLEGTVVSDATRRKLALGRARVVNFFNVLKSEQTESLRSAADFAEEVDRVLHQLEEQAAIWNDGIFHTLDFSPLEREIYYRVVAKSSPALFYMGFTDAIPHSAQVSRLCASMAVSLAARPSEVLQAALSDTCTIPNSTRSWTWSVTTWRSHPVNAAALALTVLEDQAIEKALLDYFQGNGWSTAQFIAGTVDALAVNDDSRFVQLHVILPLFVKRVSVMFGPEVARGFETIMEQRLESHSRGQQPPPLPGHLRGCLSQIRIDSGLRGISGQAWQKVANRLPLSTTTDQLVLFNQLINGENTELSADQLMQLRTALSNVASDQILKVEIPATSLMHHHQEVIPEGEKAATALVIADPMMLSPHKVAAVYDTAIIERVTAYVRSFDDNIRLLPQPPR